MFAAALKKAVTEILLAWFIGRVWESIWPWLLPKPEKGGARSFFISPWASEICKKPFRSLARPLIALFMSALWETVWLFLLTEPYNLLSKAQYSCQVKLRLAPVSKTWKLRTGLLICVALRGFIRVWMTGKWVAVVMLVWMEAEKTGESFWNVKIHLPFAICMAGIYFLPFFKWKFRQYHTAMKGLSRQPSRRRRHESTGVELPRRGQEP